MYLKSRNSSTAIKIPKSIILPVVFIHKKYSTPKINKKNNNPKAKNNNIPFSKT